MDEFLPFNGVEPTPIILDFYYSSCYLLLSLLRIEGETKSHFVGVSIK